MGSALVFAAIFAVVWLSLSLVLVFPLVELASYAVWFSVYLAQQPLPCRGALCIDKEDLKLLYPLVRIYAIYGSANIL